MQECTRDGGVLVIEDGDRHILYGPGGWVRVEADEEIGSLPVVVEGPEDAFGTYDRCIHVVVENPNRMSRTRWRKVRLGGGYTQVMESPAGVWVGAGPRRRSRPSLPRRSR